MKKNFFSVAFGAAFLLGLGMVSFTNIESSSAQTVIECPEGDKFTCWTSPNTVVYKGKGVTVIKPKEEK